MGGEGSPQNSTDTQDDGWDWPFIVYVGTTWLQRTEEELWRMTPRTFYALLDVHLRLLEAKMKAIVGKGGKGDKKQEQVVEGYIDQLPGW